MNEFLEIFEQCIVQIDAETNVIRQMTEEIIDTYRAEDLAQLFHYDIDNSDERKLDILAKNWGVVVYDTASTVSQKRKYLKGVFDLFRRAGTNTAITDALAKRGHNASVREGACDEATKIYDGEIEYNGIYCYNGTIDALYAWAFFGVLIDLESGLGLTTSEIEIITRIVMEYKPVWAVFHCLKAGYIFTDECLYAITDEITKLDMVLSFTEDATGGRVYNGEYLYNGAIAYDSDPIIDTLIITTV